MTLWRDRELQIAARRLNVLRLERLKRLRVFKGAFLKTALRSAKTDAMSPSQLKVFASQKLALFSSWGRETKPRTRCWFSGRARQARRSLLLSRMHVRSHAAQGALPQLYRRRS